MPKTRSSPGYSRGRLRVIVCAMAANFAFGIVGIVNRQYPLGLAPILFLIPALRQELGLRSGSHSGPLDSFDWSCIIAGILFLAVLPLVVLSLP